MADMADLTRIGGVLMVVGFLALGGCGKKGPLYLPDSNGEVVNGPTSESRGSSSSPSVDSPPQPPNPAPEVTEPEDQAAREKKEKEGAGTPPQH
jgi:predicted small lipoprotein YifL